MLMPALLRAGLRGNLFSKTYKNLYDRKNFMQQQKISGKVVYNFQAASDIILVELDGDGLGKSGKIFSFIGMNT